MIAFCLIFITGNGTELDFSHIREVPLLFYTGSICGLVAMIFLIIGTSHSGAMTSTVLVLMGQLGIAIVLDYVFFGEFSFAKIAGIFLILAGIAWKERQSGAERQERIRSALAEEKEGEA